MLNSSTDETLVLHWITLYIVVFFLILKIYWWRWT